MYNLASLLLTIRAERRFCLCCGHFSGQLMLTVRVKIERFHVPSTVDKNTLETRGLAEGLKLGSGVSAESALSVCPRPLFPTTVSFLIGDPRNRSRINSRYELGGGRSSISFCSVVPFICVLSSSILNPHHPVLSLLQSQLTTTLV